MNLRKMKKILNEKMKLACYMMMANASDSEEVSKKSSICGKYIGFQND